jgi:predicted Zn-dependent protease
LGGVSESTGTIEFALQYANRLLATQQPDAAAEQAREILKVAPDQPEATLLLCIALNAAGHGDAAIRELRHALQLRPDLQQGWLMLADHLTAIGDSDGADAAYARYVQAATRDPALLAAASALCENDIPRAEALLREYLKRQPTDVAAIRMFAEVAARLERYSDAENLLARCLELAPGFSAARRNYATVLHRQYKETEALAQVEQLLALDERDPTYRNLKAAVLGGLGRYPEAIELYAGILAQYPRQEKVWLNYGHALKTAGRQSDSIAAYRECLAIAPHSGTAYWSLANLKTYQFTSQDIDAMQAQLARGELPADEGVQLQFALGKALEDAKAYEESFQHYASGNQLRRAGAVYDANRTTARLQRSRQLLTQEFFAARAGFGADAADPIFILGLPRAGSTLLEQILASHSLVEGTMELPDIIAMARRLSTANGTGRSPYPGVLASLSALQCRALGEEYLARTRVQRKSAAPFFIDKMPNNFAYIAFIHLILPNAKIVDARRHPLGCCFSVYKQHFARGQHFAYDLDDLGRYYHDYVALMAHFDQVLPGTVHRVIYEDMVSDTEAEIRRLLDYCGLPFEERCLKYYENDRAVRTASSEQVRKPIFRDAVDHWRHYEPWLGPLKTALGPVLPNYPAVPQF